MSEQAMIKYHCYQKDISHDFRTWTGRASGTREAAEIAARITGSAGLWHIVPMVASGFLVDVVVEKVYTFHAKAAVRAQDEGAESPGHDMICAERGTP